MNEAAFGRFQLVATVPETVSGEQIMAKNYGRGDTVPTDAARGWAKGALFVKTDATTLDTIWHINIGTAASCNFDAAIMAS